MSSCKEVIILVGMQGSGKTHYCHNVISDYVRISQDEHLGTYAKVMRGYQKLLDEGVDKIVIDRINPYRLQRQRFVELARARGYRTKIIYFDLPRELCERRIVARREHPTLGAGKMHEAINHFISCLDLPSEEECDELVVIRSGD